MMIMVYLITLISIVQTTCMRNMYMAYPTVMQSVMLYNTSHISTGLGVWLSLGIFYLLFSSIF
jgi:hypothetical protein